MKKELEAKTKILRKKGYSVKELHKIIGVSKSTISGWIKGVELNEEAKKRLLKNYTNGQLAAQKIIAKKSKEKIEEADNYAKKLFSNLTIGIEFKSILCAMIYFCEGNKSPKSFISFTNSDPSLVASFLYLFRNSFSLDEKRFRILMHLHKYHDEETQKKFWSKVTNIPSAQFNRTYFKPNSGKYKKDGYQGCVKIQYADVSMGRKIQSIAKMFMERYK